MGLCMTAECQSKMCKYPEVKLGKNYIIDQKELERKMNKNENFSKLIYLQLNIRKYLKKKRPLIITNLNSNKITNKQNINLNINVNVNMPNVKREESLNKSNNNLILSYNQSNSINLIKNNSINENKIKDKQNILQIKENNIKDEQKKNTLNTNNSTLIIPSVHPEQKESLLQCDEAFKKMTSITKDKDPREGPMDNKRRIYPKINEEGSSYLGEWKNGKRDGYGVLTWQNKSVFIGQFIEDKITGFGKLLYESGDVYTGYFLDFRADGVGSYKTKNNANYNGYWIGDKQNGFGVENWPKGSSYEGEYVDGSKDGIGILTFEDNGGYKGEFVQGTINGVGTFYFSDGRKFEGSWYNNKMNGFGIITWPDGKVYEGEFNGDKKEGFGVFYANTKIYIGMWKDNQLDGNIIIIDKQKKIKKQHWECGKATKNLDSNYYINYQKFVDEIIQNRDYLDEI